ncbi:MAG: hypothetical protein Kow006_00420 [Gammaproteobacteria bacterium]
MTGLLVLLGLLGWGLYYWSEIPRTPRELFEKRCSTCHELPDLSGYARHELAPLVRFMRTHNGASRVISDSEEQVIIDYLENNRSASSGATGTPAASPLR